MASKIPHVQFRSDETGATVKLADDAEAGESVFELIQAIWIGAVFLVPK